MKWWDKTFACPECDSRDITRSHRTPTERFFLVFMSSLPYRCRECGKRFYLLDHRSLFRFFCIVAAVGLLLLAAAVFVSDGSNHLRSIFSIFTPGKEGTSPC